MSQKLKMARWEQERVDEWEEAAAVKEFMFGLDRQSAERAAFDEQERKGAK